MAGVQDGLSRFADGGGAFGELEHAGPLRALAAFLRWQSAVGVYFLLESPEERFSCRARAGTSVRGARP